MTNPNDAVIAGGDKPAVLGRLRRTLSLGGLWRRLRPVALLIAPAPLAMIIFLQHDDPVGRIMLVTACMVASLIGAVWWKRDLIRSNRRNLVATVLLISCALIALTVVWNDEYIKFAKTVSRHEIFRLHLQRHTTPLYGTNDSASPKRAWPVVAVALVAGFLMLRSRMDRPVRWYTLAIVAILQIAAILTFARSEDRARFTGHSPQLEEFRFDADHFRSMGDLCRRYVATMPYLSWFGQHYPPGNAMLYRLEVDWNIPGFVLGVLIASTVLTGYMIYRSARELSNNPMVHHMALLCYAAATAPLVFTTTSMSVLPLLPAAIAGWGLIRACKTGSIVASIVLGVVMTGFTLLSLSAIFLGLAMGLCVLLACLFRQIQWSKAFKCAGISLASAIAAILLIKYTTQLDLIACARVGVTLHHEQAANNGFDNFDKWFIRSTGNLLAFLMLNLPMIALLGTTLIMWRRADFRSLPRLIGLSLAITLVVAAFSGKFYLETERIWVFFIPLLALASAVELARHSDYRGRWDARIVIVMMIVYAAAQEIAFTHHV